MMNPVPAEPHLWKRSFAIASWMGRVRVAQAILAGGMRRAAGKPVWPRRAFTAFLMIGAATIATSRAHDPGISTAEAQVYADRVEITTGFAPGDANHFLPPALRLGSKWSEEDFEPARAPLLAVAPGLWEMREGDAMLTPREVNVELLPEDNVSFLLVFPRDRDRGRLMLHAPKLGELPSGHRQFLIVADERGSTLAKKLLRAGDASLEVPLGATTPAADVAADDQGGARVSNAAAFRGFFKLGVEHIWTGYDHLLFLFALLVVCRSFRSIVAIVSCFTLAHSITLALATLDVVTLPPTWVEPAIAASIVFVGVENLWRRGEEPRGRWALTFVFGLIHGFGFAGVLRDLGIGRIDGEGIAMPLFSFNLGVEVGQVAIAAAVLPIVWRLRKRQGFARRGVPMLSALVALAGLYWLMERTVLG